MPGVPSKMPTAPTTKSVRVRGSIQIQMWALAKVSLSGLEKMICVPGMATQVA